MRILVTGHKDVDPAIVVAKLDELLTGSASIVIITGTEAGAEKVAMRWATERGLPRAESPVNWKKHKKNAYQIRTSALMPHVDQVIAFMPRQWHRDLDHLTVIAKARKVQVTKL